jgi:hypothetical protein
MARITSGWIKLHRKSIESDLISKPYLWTLWSWMLLNATWKETKIVWRGEQRIIPPGSVVYGISELAIKWECSKATVSKWVKYLVLSERIANETSPSGCIATVRNWDTYQYLEGTHLNEGERFANTARTRREHGANLIEEGKKERRNKAPTKLEYSNEFEIVWNLYGGIGKKKYSSECFSRCQFSPDDLVDLHRAIKVYHSKSKPDYRMHLSTFLNEDWRVYLQGKIGAPETLKNVADAEAILRGEEVAS